MQAKLIAVALGFAGGGALFGWAITADRYEQKLKEKEEHVDILRDKLKKQKEEPKKRAYVVRERPGGGFEAIMPVQEERPLFTVKEPFEDHPTLFDDAIQTPEVESPPEKETLEVADADDEEEVDEEKTEAIRSNLQHIIDQYTDNSDDRDRFVDRGENVYTDNSPPYVISREVFSFDEVGEEFEKLTVTYYPNSRVVLDEDDEVIDDPGQVLGWRNLSRFGEESGDEDVVFVRNPRLLIDYEVVRDYESPLPLHVKYGLGREEFNVAKAAGTLRLRDEDL